MSRDVFETAHELFHTMPSSPMRCFKRRCGEESTTEVSTSKIASEQNLEEEIDESDALYKGRFNVHRELYNQPKFAKSHPVSPFVGFSFLSMLGTIYEKNIKPSSHCAKKNLFNRIPGNIFFQWTFACYLTFWHFYIFAYQLYAWSKTTASRSSCWLTF